MKQSQDRSGHGNQLKKLDFVAWRVQKAKDSEKAYGVHRILFERPRQRRITRH